MYSKCVARLVLSQPDTCVMITYQPKYSGHSKRNITILPQWPVLVYLWPYFLFSSQHIRMHHFPINLANSVLVLKLWNVRCREWGLPTFHNWLAVSENVMHVPVQIMLSNVFLFHYLICQSQIPRNSSFHCNTHLNDWILKICFLLHISWGLVSVLSCFNFYVFYAKVLHDYH